MTVWLLFGLLAPGAPRDDGLLAWLPFDGDAAEANRAVAAEALGPVPIPDRFGRPDRALWFDGEDDQVVLAPPTGLRREGFSVTLWVMFDLPPDRPGHVDVMDGGGRHTDPLICQDDGLAVRCWRLGLIDDKILWHRLGVYSSAWTDWRVEPERWYHLAATWDGDRHALYVDGERQMEVDGVFKVSHEEPIRVGCMGDEQTGWIWFRGCLDELRLYDRALSQEEIAAQVDAPAE